MTPCEEWRPVVGYEGRYEINADGTVRNARTGHIKKQQVGQGYAWVALHDGGKPMRPGKIHRLLAQAFLPPPLPGQTDVCHNDGNPANNRLDNLRWDTHAANMADRRIHGTVRNQNTGKTHCKRGHEFTPANTMRTKNGSRHCLACRRRAREG